MSHRTLLQDVYLFKNLSAPEIEIIANIAETQNFMPGDTIFLKGEPAKAIYFIKHGSIKIQQGTKGGDSIDVATLGAGSHFGEMAFIDGEPRSATATAADSGELVCISYERLMTTINKNKEIAVKVYRELAHFLAGRLRVTTSDLNFAREKNLTHF